MHVWSIIRPIRKKNTAITYRFVLGRFRKQFEKARVDKLTSEEILSLLAAFTEGKKAEHQVHLVCRPSGLF